MTQATAGQATLYQISERSTRILESTTDLSRNGAEVQTRLESLQLTQLDLDRTIRARFDRLEEVMATLVSGGSQRSDLPIQRLLAKPSNMKTLCDEFLSQDSDAGSISNRRRSKCNCIRRTTRSFHRSQWGPLTTSSSITSHEEHMPGCPLSNFGKRSMKKYALQLTGLKGTLSTAIQVMFSVRTGAGGGGLGMNFTYFATVDRWTCPTYRILDVALDAITPAGAIQNDLVKPILESAANRILWCFATRRASPTDIEHDGSSLMHEAARFAGNEV